MRLHPAVNWAFLGVNAVLFVLLSVSWGVFLLRSGSELRPHRLPEGQRLFGMEFRYEKGPFSLMVGKDFPRDGSFILEQRGRPLSIFAQDSDYSGDPSIRTVLVSLGADFYISCDYSFAGGGVKVRELGLSHENNGSIESFTDHNAKGAFDLRQTRDVKRRVSRMYVWFQGAWREVAHGDKGPAQDGFHKQLIEGDRVSFDNKSGRWVSSAEKPATGGKEKEAEH